MRKLIAIMGLLFLFCSSRAVADTIVVKCSEDYYQGDALFSTAIDGVNVAASTACTARNSPAGTPSPTPQTITFTGTWGTTVAHKIKITFLNDAYGGSSSTDRNLYVQAVSYNGQALPAPVVVGHWARVLGTAGAYLGSSGDNGTWTTNIGNIPTITVQPVSQTVNYGAAATFSVTAMDATSYQWKKGTTAISGATSSSYTDVQALSKDSGSKYSVVVMNSSGSITSNQATLTVRITATLDNGNSTFTTTLPGYDSLAQCTTLACISVMGGTAGTPLVSLVVGSGSTHSVSLSWSGVTTCTDGSPCFATSYIIYRGQVNGGPYAKIGSSQTVSYMDTSVISGQTYFYVVTAVVQNMNPPESAYSNQTTAVIP